MTQNPETDPAVSLYSPQRMEAAHEQNRPQAGPVGLILTALVAEDNYNYFASRYQDADHFWGAARDRKINADPAAQKAKKRCREISDRIAELQNPQNSNKGEIANLRAELETANKPYVTAARRASASAEIQSLAASREQERLKMEQARQDMDRARRRALGQINQSLPRAMTWPELEEILGADLKQRLETTEIRLLEATIDRQEAVATANAALKAGLARIRAGQAAAIHLGRPQP